MIKFLIVFYMYFGFECYFFLLCVEFRFMYNVSFNIFLEILKKIFMMFLKMYDKK